MRDQLRQTQQLIDPEVRPTIRNRQERILRAGVGPRQGKVDPLARLPQTLHALRLAPATVVADQLELLTAPGMKLMGDAEKSSQLIHDRGNKWGLSSVARVGAFARRAWDDG